MSSDKPINGADGAGGRMEISGSFGPQQPLTESELKSIIDEFRRLSREPKGNSRGWKFNRDEIHERR